MNKSDRQTQMCTLIYFKHRMRERGENKSKEFGCGIERFRAWGHLDAWTNITLIRTSIGLQRNWIIKTQWSFEVTNGMGHGVQIILKKETSGPVRCKAHSH